MNQKLLSKVLATMLAVTLTFTNFVMLGVYASKTYASEDELETQSIVSNNENVKFDAYFASENGEKVHTANVDLDETIKLYLSVNVEKGYLKNAKIIMQDKEGNKTNFRILSEENKFESVESIDINTNVIMLKQINAGTGVVLEVPIASVKNDVFDLSDFNKINNITLTGSYVSNSGSETNINKTINIRNQWTKEVNIFVEQETKTFIPYEVNETKGTILQTIIKTGLENNALPIKETVLTIKAPELNGLKPEQVTVNANTNATNNNDKFTSENWAYNNETGDITVTVENNIIENKVAWNKQDKDEYVITYVYNDKIETIDAGQDIEVSIVSYNSTKELNQNDTLEIKENELKGSFVTTQIETESMLSKGHLYSNQNVEVEYNENLKIDIAYANLVEKLIIQNNTDSFVNSDEEIISAENNTYYKSTSISKDNFEEILGLDGYVKIIGKDGEQLAIFTKETTADENGYFKVEYQNEINEMKIETSKPIVEGILEINNVKELKGTNSYRKNQVLDFEALQLKSITNVEYANILIQNVETIKDINLIAPSTKFEVSVNNANLSTVVKNKNVELKVALKTNDISCDLYKNPVIEIVMPSYISEIEIKDIDLLFDDELKIKNRTAYRNLDGNVVVKVVLEGEQTLYSQNEISKGANIVINSDITLKKLTPTKDDIIKVYVVNENVTTYETVEQTRIRTFSANGSKGYTETLLRAVAPTGMVTTTTASGYNKAGETVTSISGEEGIGTLDAKSSSVTASLEMNVINNYNNKIGNIKILGRIPNEGNKSVVSNQDLESNFDTILGSMINLVSDANNYAIYYSANKEATIDLDNSANGWSSNFSNFGDISSYLIIIDPEYQMNTGDQLSFDYNIIIPNIEYNKSVYSNYVVYFDNIKETETIEDKQIATKIGLTTGAGPILEVALRDDIEGEIEEGTIITYTISVRNAGNETINNVTVSGNIPEGTTYTYLDGIPGGEDIVSREYDDDKEEYSYVIPEIAPNEVKTVSYQVEANPLFDETSKQIEVQGKVNVENYEATFTSSEVTNTIIKGYLRTELEMQPEYEDKKEGQEFNYIATITNVNFEEKKNVVVTDKLPDGVTFVSASGNGLYNKSTNTVTWNIDTINGKGTEILVLGVKINELPQGQSIKQITNSMSITTNEKQLKTNEVTFNVSKPILTITQSSSTFENVSAGDMIEYNFTIKNVGEVNANNIIITDYMPEGLLYRGSKYILDGQTYESWIGNRDATINISSLKPGKTVDIIIKALVEDTDENKVERKIINIAGVEADGFTKIGSNEVSHNIVLKVQTQDPSVERPIEGTHKILGQVWLDKNHDGKKDEAETLLKDIRVILVNSETGKIVTDPITGVRKEQLTNASGIYTFANLNPGKYLVVFFYDSVNYNVTKYKADGVIDSKNSDVVSMKVALDGETVTAGVANSIQIGNSDITNIDMGLIESAKFDFKLDMGVSKITVNASNGTKTYEFDNVKLAKVDIKDKELSVSTVIVEYKIKVTNEGGVEGYVKKIVDYIPKDMKFNSELNPDWYITDSGNAFNASLANTLIKPGESKEVTLILTKKMTENNTGTINNVAEIYEASNDYGLQDIDSTVANKIQSEDDISLADTIIGIKTGEVYVYIIITLISISIFGVGIYLINKKVLRKI